VDPRLEARIAARTGLLVSHHRIEFYGLCADCAPGRKRPPSRRRRPAGRGPSSPKPSSHRGGTPWPSRSREPRVTRT
jgi:hypothetical protein